MCYNRVSIYSRPRVSAPTTLAYGDASMTPSIPQKQCTKCNQNKPATVEYFHRNKNSSDGLVSACKTCIKKDSRKYYEANKDKMLKANAEWREKHPEEMKAYKDKYVEKNPEKVLVSKQTYYDTHSDYIYEQVKRRRNESPEKYEAHKAVQIAVQRRDLDPIDTQLCTSCGKQAQHYHHWSYLPEHQLDVIALCVSCHKKEHAK